MGAIDIEGRFDYFHKRLADLENLYQHHVHWHKNQIDGHHKKQDDELAQLREDYNRHYARFHNYEDDYE